MLNCYVIFRECWLTILTNEAKTGGHRIVVLPLDSVNSWTDQLGNEVLKKMPTRTVIFRIREMAKISCTHDEVVGSGKRRFYRAY